MDKVSTKTIYTDKMLRDFSKYRFRTLNLIIVILGAITAICGAITLFFTSVWTGVITCLLGVFFLFYPKMLVIISISSNKRLINSEEEIIFGEKSMVIKTTINGEQVVNNETKYSILQKLAQDDKYIYVYVTKNSAILLEKKNLTLEEQGFICNNINNELPKRK